MKVKPFEVIPRMMQDKTTGKAVARGWNLKWPDGSTGIPAGFMVLASDWSSKEVIKAVGTIAAHRGFKGFASNRS